MSDTVVEQVEATETTLAEVTPEKPAKRGAAQKEKKPAATKKSPAAVKKAPKAKPNHPPTGEMVTAAIKTLKERKGSSLQAIKKYLAANYKVDAAKMAPFIKKYLKSAVASGVLIQPKGTGASGSFKFNDAKPKKAAVAKKPVAKKAIPAKKPVVAAKKAAPAKKAVAAKKAKAVPAKKAATPKAKPALKQKATKPSKAAAPKTKAPIPKKAVPTKKATTATPKRAAPKRK